MATMRSHDGSPNGNHEPKQPKQGEGAGHGGASVRSAMAAS
jgi:hypothetical protein